MNTPKGQACPKHTRPILFLWGYDDDGNPYMDARVDINTVDMQKFKSFELRLCYQSDLHLALLHISKDMTMDAVEEYIHSAKYHHHMREDVVKKLQAAKVSLGQIMRKDSGANSINFIQALVNEDESCTCDERNPLE